MMILQNFVETENIHYIQTGETEQATYLIVSNSLIPKIHKTKTYLSCHARVNIFVWLKKKKKKKPMIMVIMGDGGQ